MHMNAYATYLCIYIHTSLPRRAFSSYLLDITLTACMQSERARLYSFDITWGKSLRYRTNATSLAGHYEFYLV